MNNVTKSADLHMHTHFSDGTDSPEQVVEKSVQNNLGCIAITDHDTLAGIAPAQEAAKKYDLEVVPGVELSTEHEGSDIHMLGYFVNFNNGPLTETLEYAQNARVKRVEEMLSKLKDLGIDNIELQEVCDLVQSKSVGRPHLATILMQKGWVSTIKEAFDKYLAEGGPAYVAKYKISPSDAIDLVIKSGGVPVMAHPMSTNKDELIPQFVKAGLKGLEVYYPNQAQSTIKYYETIAQKHNLIMTGGSDAHGDAKPNTYIGKATVPYSAVEQLKALAS